jgi:hypothetical protein
MYSTNNDRNHPPYTPANPPYVPAPPPPPTFSPPSHATQSPLPSFVQPAIDPRLRTAAIAILISAAVLAVAALTKAWFVPTGSRDGGLGLLGLESCRRGLCQSTSWFDVPRVPSEIPIFATTALIAIAGTIGLLIHTGVKLLQGAPEGVRVHYLAVAFGCALLGCFAFVASLSIGDNARGLTLGWSTIVAFAGLLATGITTLVMVRPLTQQR